MRRRHELEERLDLMRRMRAFMQSVRGAEPRQGEHISHEEFDRSGKGYITEADLARVLGGRVGGEQFGEWLAGGSNADREGYRVTYGSYLQLMTNVIPISPSSSRHLSAPVCRQVPLMSATDWLAHQVLKQTVEPGNFIFRQGDPADYFYCIISGEVEIVRLHLG